MRIQLVNFCFLPKVTLVKAIKKNTVHTKDLFNFLSSLDISFVEAFGRGKRSSLVAFGVEKTETKNGFRLVSSEQLKNTLEQVFLTKSSTMTQLFIGESISSPRFSTEDGKPTK